MLMVIDQFQLGLVCMYIYFYLGYLYVCKSNPMVELISPSLIIYTINQVKFYVFACVYIYMFALCRWSLHAKTKVRLNLIIMVIIMITCISICFVKIEIKKWSDIHRFWNRSRNLHLSWLDWLHDILIVWFLNLLVTFSLPVVSDIAVKNKIRLM